MGSDGPQKKQPGRGPGQVAEKPAVRDFRQHCRAYLIRRTAARRDRWGNGPCADLHAAAGLPVTAIQDHYSLWMREPERTKFGVCQELNIGLVAWGPLGQGFLTGAITRDMTFDDPNDLRKDFPRFTPEALEANFKVVDFLKNLAARKGITSAQIALAWLLAQKPWVVPIPGGTKVAHLDDNLRAADVKLTASDLKEIDDAFAGMDINGAPLSAALDAAIDR